ncbi:hypothetical protein [Ruminococcus sp.]
MRIYEVQERTTPLLEKLLDIWEQSVRVTHTFLSEEGLKRLKTYVPAAICDVEHLLIAEAIPHKERLATLHAICLQISRHISQKCS